MERIKYTEVAEYRAALLRAQNFVCSLCQRTIEPNEATLDHCHKTGHTRGVLHRNCNGILGRVEHWSGRVKMTDRIDFLENVIKYLNQDYSKRPTHPTFKKKKR